jgi:hypothetical protein
VSRFPASASTLKQQSRSQPPYLGQKATES